jgi:uncharacterized protein
MPRLIFLAVESSVLFLAIPLLIFHRVLPNLPIPYLLMGALGAFVVLRRDPTFDLKQLTAWNGVRSHIFPLLLRNAVCLVVPGFAVRGFAPELLFSFLRRSPALWAVVFVLYPLLSVFPQELLYRGFFFHRYQPLFGSGGTMVIASAFAFGFVHIIFDNRLAVCLSLFGGFLFSLTYYSSGSLVLACLDHAMFGDFLFTIGLGQFFYHGFRG